MTGETRPRRDIAAAADIGPIPLASPDLQLGGRRFDARSTVTKKMKADPKRLAEDAANHITVGLLQGLGFALAGGIVGFVSTAILRHPTGFLAGIAVFAWLFMRAKKRNQTYIEVHHGRK